MVFLIFWIYQRIIELKNLFTLVLAAFMEFKKISLREKFRTDNPIQLYAATKKSNEVIAASYSHLYNMSTIGLRFFTVYGPWGRPIWLYLSLQKTF